MAAIFFPRLRGGGKQRIVRAFRFESLSASLLLFTGVVVFPKVALAVDHLFPAGAVIDVTKPPYSAIPNDAGDDTAALQQAISENVGTGRVLYFPAGVYRISDSLVAKNTKGVWDAHLTLQGQAPEKVILRLKDDATGFSDPSRPKAMVITASHFEPGDAKDGGGNKAFRNNLFDLTLDTGSNNPGAVAVEYAVSNFGAIENVDIRSGDGNGVAGISMLRRIPGPGLIKNVRIDGFDVGLDLGDIQYGITLENITVRNQKRAGIRLSKNLLHIRGLKSLNRVPAVVVTDRSGVLTLIDAQLEGGSAEFFAIRCEGNIFLRHVLTRGYRAAALEWRGESLVGPDYASLARPKLTVATEADSTTAEGLLSIEETPDYGNADLSDWEAVRTRQAGESDDTAAIQRAIDSGRGTVYFPNHRVYFLSDTVVIRGAVRQILGLGSEISLGAAEVPFSNSASPRPLFRIDATTTPTVFIEGLFFNAQYPGELLFENNSPNALVIKHCGGWVGRDGVARSYRNTKLGTGRVFLEDNFLPGWEFTGQDVWARQLNPENWAGDGSEAQVTNRGGNLWILGFKTEGPAPFIATEDGGTTELLGGYNYISATKSPRVHQDRVPYIVTDSRAALSFATDNFRNSSDYKVYIHGSSPGRVEDWKAGDLAPRNGIGGDRSLVVPHLVIGVQKTP